MRNEAFKHSDITGKTIGCAMAVHNAIGNGFQEVIYQRALGIELVKAGISFIREQEMKIYYDGMYIGTRRVDFFIENSVMLEIKAVSKLEAVHWAQTINYLEAFDLEVGLLVNFGSKKLEFKRFVNTVRSDV